MGSESTPEGSSHTAKTLHQEPDDLESVRAKRQRRGTEESGEAPGSKARVRVTRACDECRRRKDRCDGQRPSCQPCLAAKRPCTYNPSKKRGLRTGYVRSLEILFGLLLGTVDGLEAWISTLLEGEVSTPQLGLATLAEGIEDASEFAMNKWRKSDVLKTLEQVLSLSQSHDDEEESSDSFESRLSRALTGLSLQQNADVPSTKASPLLPTNLANADVNSSILFQPSAPNSAIIPLQDELSAHPTSSPTYFEAPDLTSPRIAEETTIRDHLTIPPNWSYLLELHFAKTHSWFPISHKHDLLRSAYTLANNSQLINVATLSQRGDAAFFWAALAYASQQSDALDASRGQEPQCQNMTARLHETAKRLVAVDPGCFEVGHVRALLLLTLYETTRESWKAAWAMVGRAVYAITSLELVGAVEQSQAAIDEGTKRTLLGCIALETLLASRLHLRSYFRRSDLRRIGALQTDGIEEWEPWQPRMSSDHQQLSHLVSYNQSPGQVLSIFSKFIDAIGILNDMLTEPISGGGQHGVDTVSHESDMAMPQPIGDIFVTEVSPQVINIHLLISCIEYIVKFRTSTRKSRRPIPSMAERHGRILQLCDALKRGMQERWGLWMPPSIPVYLFLLHEMISTEKDVVAGPESKSAHMACLDALSATERVWREQHNAIPSGSVPQSEPTIGSVDRHSDQTTHTPQTTFRGGGMQIAPLTPISSDPSQASFSRLLSLPNMSDPTFPNLEDGAIPLVENQISETQGTQTMDRLAALSKPPQRVEMNAFPGSLMGNMEQEELFDSLATLDPIDWVANPPDFMRHLGDLRDAPTDIHSFFDPDIT